MTSLYNNIGGSRKTISSAYGNISGSRKQIFPYSTTTTYTWYKYTISEESYINESYESTDIDIYDSAMNETGSTVYYGSSYTTSGNKVRLTGVSSVSRSNFLTIGSDKMYSGYVFRDSGFGSETSVTLSAGYSTYLTSFYKNSSSIWADGYVNFTCYVFKTAGSYLGQVTSTNRSAYPDNNYSGSYWYVFVS